MFKKIYIWKNLFSKYSLELFKNPASEWPIREVDKSRIMWYPGHIEKGKNTINEKLLNCNLLIEIRDARIPITSQISTYENISEIKQRIIIYNKSDLVLKNEIRYIKHWASKNNLNAVNIFSMSLKNYSNSLFEQIENCIRESMHEESKPDYNVMIGGLPNVGKSTFINAFRSYSKAKYGFEKIRSKKPSGVGSNAGVTRHVSEKILVSEGPPRIFLLDTPGIWDPKQIMNQSDAAALDGLLKLAICGNLNWDQIQDKEAVVDFLIYTMLRKKQPHFLTHYSFKKYVTINNLTDLLDHICYKHSFVKQRSKFTLDQSTKFLPDYDKAINLIYRNYNEGVLGNFVLDDLPEYINDKNINSRTANINAQLQSTPLGTIINNQTIYQSTTTKFPFRLKKTKTHM